MKSRQPRFTLCRSNERGFCDNIYILVETSNSSVTDVDSTIFPKKRAHWE